MDIMESWIKSRPQCVQDLIKEFPIGSTFDVNGKSYHLLGYTEDDTLIVSQIDPRESYDEAQENKEYLCASHFRQSPHQPERQRVDERD